jgi:hypothetical protein
MAPVELCPKLIENAPAHSSNLHMTTEELFTPQELNELAEDSLQQRDQAISNYRNLISQNGHDIDGLLQQHESSWLALRGLRISRKSQDQYLSLPRLSPLDNCIISIVWETLKLSAHDLLVDGDVVRFMVLLRSASLYQAKSEKVSYNRLLNFIS